MGKGIEIAVEKISPTTAKNWLTKMAPNRNFNESRAKQYAADMLAGDWKLNGVPIVFNGDGSLIDGQHRLEAIVRAGATQQMTVVRGVAVDAMSTFDIGLPRHLKDFLRINGEMYSATIATILRNMWRWDRYKTFKQSSYAQTQPTVRQSLDYFEENADEFRYAAMLGVANSKRTMLPDSLIGSLFIIFTGVDEDDAEDFFTQLGTGADMGDRHPIMALRRRLIENKAARDKLSSNLKAALTIKAWNAYREGRDVQALAWRAGGKNPEPFPLPR
jgi:hypothetical protein